MSAIMSHAHNHCSKYAGSNQPAPSKADQSRLALLTSTLVAFCADVLLKAVLSCKDRTLAAKIRRLLRRYSLQCSLSFEAIFNSCGCKCTLSTSLSRFNALALFHTTESSTPGVSRVLIAGQKSSSSAHWEGTLPSSFLVGAARVRLEELAPPTASGVAVRRPPRLAGVRSLLTMGIGCTFCTITGVLCCTGGAPLEDMEDVGRTGFALVTTRLAVLGFSTRLLPKERRTVLS